MSAPKHILRLAVKVRGKAVNGLDAEQHFAVDETVIAVKQRWPFLIVTASGFASEAEAVAYLPRLKAGLFRVAITFNIAFQPYFERRSITRPATDPIQTARNLAKSFGQILSDPIEPVHGLTEEEGYTVFRSDENIRYVSLGDLTAHVSTNWITVRDTLADGIRRGCAPLEGSSTELAVDLYLSNFYESSLRARLLTLTTCLEVLAPVTQRHPSALEALVDFKRAVEVRLIAAKDDHARDALDALVREIDFKTETSIRRRIRELVLSEVPLPQDQKNDLAKKVVAAYDLRSTLVHAGKVDSRELSIALDVTLTTVKMLLGGRLELAPQHTGN